MRSSERTGRGCGSGPGFKRLASWPLYLPAKSVADAFDGWLFSGKSANADHVRPSDEGLWPEAENDAVASPRLGISARLDHAVVVDGGRSGELDVQRRRRGSRLAGDDRPYLVVGKDRIDVEAAAKAKGLVADEMRDFGQVNDC